MTITTDRLSADRSMPLGLAAGIITAAMFGNPLAVRPYREAPTPRKRKKLNPKRLAQNAQRIARRKSR